MWLICGTQVCALIYISIKFGLAIFSALLQLKKIFVGGMILSPACSSYLCGPDLISMYPRHSYNLLRSITKHPCCILHNGSFVLCQFNHLFLSCL